MKPKQQSLATVFRLPEDLKKYLKHMAVDHGRTLNAEVIERLQESRQREEQGRPQP